MRLLLGLLSRLLWGFPTVCPLRRRSQPRLGNPQQVQQAYLDSLPLFTEVLLSWSSSQKGLFLGLGKQAGRVTTGPACFSPLPAWEGLTVW